MDIEMRMRGTGGAIPGLNSSNFKSLPWPKLSPAGTTKLNQSLSILLRKLLQFGVENQRLEIVRDTLLPELISGRMKAVA